MLAATRLVNKEDLSIKAKKHKTYSTVSRLNIFTPSVTKTGVELVLENILLLCAILPSTEVCVF